MYCDYFGFSEKPFVITPNPRFIFLGKNHREAFAHLIYGIDSHAGFIELTGEVGTGKTTVLRTLLGQLEDKRYRTALILNPCLSAEELLRAINREFGVPWEGLSRAALVERLGQFLLEENSAGRTVVLVIDEAQNLDPRVLEQVRLISNLETESDKLIQIVLSGQPELEELLSRPDLRQIAQRITVRYHLNPMDREDMAAYIRHRLEVAGGVSAALFSPKALDMVYTYSGGYPRLVNIACDRILLAAYGDETRDISPRLARQAIDELKREKKTPKAMGGRKLAITFAIIAAAAVVGLLVPKAMKNASVSAPVVTTAKPADTSGYMSLALDLATQDADNSRLQAFNAAVASQGIYPYRPAAGSSIPSLERLARSRRLEMETITGNTAELLRHPLPLLLSIKLPGGHERWLTLQSRDRDTIAIAPRIGSRRSIRTAELEQLKPAAAYLLHPTDQAARRETP